MIKSVTVTNYLGDSLKIELTRPEESGFIISNITGLGPGSATVNMTETATNDGSIFNSSRIPSRNIVIGLRFLHTDGYTIEEVRQLSYKYFPLKKKCKLLIETDNRKAEITGYVESNDPTIFSKEEGTNISILCPDPYFYSSGDEGVNVTVFSGIDAEFYFPFSNESTSQKMLTMGSLRHQTEKTIYYNGDAETGVRIVIHAIGLATKIVIYNTGTKETMKIDTDKLASFTGSGISAGDDIIINTSPGHKSIYLVRAGEVINILHCLDKSSSWFKLVKGDNTFAYSAETGSSNLQFKIENRVVYEGV